MIRFEVPSTRFLGSKARLLPWIYQNVVGLNFSTVLDAFGGTASVSYMFKALGKEVYFNDILKFNQDIATAIIENKNVKVTKKDIQFVLKPRFYRNKKIIQKNFKNIYFTNNENKWLDQTIQNIQSIGNKYKQTLFLSALYQAALVKRPFNLFHRKNLYLRTNNVKRSFGNKKTWDTPFRTHFLRYLKEYNNAVFDNNRSNTVIGGFDATKIPNKRYDLVYLDPPYLSKSSDLTYLAGYHFLEGISRYKQWESLIDYTSVNKTMHEIPELTQLLDEEKICSIFKKLFIKFRQSIIVMSYRNDGTPSIRQITNILKDATGKDPIIKKLDYKYALSNGSTQEVLFIIKN